LLFTRSELPRFGFAPFRKYFSIYSKHNYFSIIYIVCLRNLFRKRA